MNLKEIQNLARRQHEAFLAREKDPRYIRVIGRLKMAGLIESNHVKTNRLRLKLEDVLWVGETEPRVLEILPAILIKKPTMITVTEYPEDLREVLAAIRLGQPRKPFRGQTVQAYMQWIPRIGHKGKGASALRTYRFNADDIQLLNALKEKTGAKEVDVLRRAMTVLLEKIR